MGGSGGGGTFVHHSPERLQDLVRREEDKTRNVAFETALAGELSGLLGSYNSRDVEAIRERLEDLTSALEGRIDGKLDQLFGGSVAKHTYVDGLSDIDSLIIVNDSSVSEHSPSQIISMMKDIISEYLGDKALVTAGRMAVTIEYRDGMVIQLLPALKTEDGNLRVPSSRRTDEWSKINPISFQEALTSRNFECGGKLVPTIKLAKAIIGQIPEAQRLSGYHVESLGIAAFRNYEGPTTTPAMLPAFFERARELVLQPIRDSTGQSVHVDEYLGPAGSEARQAASHVLGRLARRMRNATAAESIAQWRSMFGGD
ncbi:CBASS oligonucleotide cyclase [Nisaea sediminum]|uniref:CBASS oligonucleotide cyclase n=1 Tax=Nisaea sediminum TaxID=2775867 RepID=UPI0018694A69|nr:CBASS oligonucleotide cyclase [Nisaea sediminum]